MGTPNRQLIIDNIKTTLESITVANGYKTTVHTVEILVENWETVGGNERPWIGFKPNSQTIETMPFNTMRARLPFSLVAHVNTASKALTKTALDNLHDDIIAALLSDITRGGNACFTTITSHDDDIGNSDSTDSRGVGGTLRVEFEVVYFRNISLA